MRFFFTQIKTQPLNKLLNSFFRKKQGHKTSLYGMNAPRAKVVTRRKSNIA